MRVLFLGNSSGGLLDFRREILQAMLEDGCEVHGCVPYDPRVKDFIRMGGIYEPCEFDRHGTNPFAELRLLRQYRRIITAVAPDAVFTFTIKPNIYGGMVCARERIPYTANITGLGTAVGTPGMLRVITLLLYRWALRRAQMVFFQNAENRDFMLKRHIVKGEYDLLPGSGVNLSRFAVLEYPAQDTIEFAFISRLMKEKGTDQYLEAAESIKKKYPNTVFHVCGLCEEDYRGRLKKLQEKGVIVYHGTVSDIREILKIIHCTVHPTYYPEGLSNVLLESCASGRPIITTDRAGCREVIDDSINGYIVKQKNSADLVEKIEKFIALPWEEKRQMGLNGRKKVENKFDRQIVVKKYREILKEVSGDFGKAT